MAFLPNENSRASLLLGYVRDHMPNAGDTVTYEELFDMLDVERANDDVGQMFSGVVAEVNKRLHRDGDWRHLLNVERVGYKIGTPSDLRLEAMARMRRSERQQVANQRAIEKVVRHPDATAAERKRATDVVAQQGDLLILMRRHHRKIHKLWPSEEVSPVDEP